MSYLEFTIDLSTITKKVNTEDIIFHIKAHGKYIWFDVRSFYPTVESNENPQLKGKPIAVYEESKNKKGRKRRCITSANKLAKNRGIKPTKTSFSIAQKIVPDLVLIKANIPKYQKAFENILSICRLYYPNAKRKHSDEAPLDLTNIAENFHEVELIASDLRKKVEQELNYTLTFGISWTEWLAKMATKINKDNPLNTIQTQNDISSYLYPMLIEELYYFPKERKLLKQIRIKTIGDVMKQPYPLDFLVKKLSKRGAELYCTVHGIEPLSERFYKETIYKKKKTKQEHTIDIY